MAHRNKSRRKREDKRWRREQRQRQQQEQEDVVQHSAATLTCAAETAGDFAGQCAHEGEELGLDLPYLRVALEIWREQPPSTQTLVAALEELLSERLRYHEALNRISQQLEHLASDPSLHIHLDPIERYRELVRNRLFPQPPPE